jgi:tol-pal system protein YbgF
MCVTRFLIVMATSMLLLQQGYAIAPVVDDSQRYAALDDEGDVRSTPTTPYHSDANEDTPIAKVLPEDKPSDNSLAGEVRALQQDVQALRGELEVQAHAIEQLKQQQSALKPTPTAAIITSPASSQATPTASITPPTPEPAPAVNQATTANPADEQVAYLAAYDLIKSKRYDEALKAMQTFVSEYPNGGYSANAEYWMGELYLVKNKPLDSIQHFEVVLNRFPNSSKAAASTLKIGYAFSALGKKEEAKQRLREVIKNYPDTAAAQLAKIKLESLK